MAFTPEPYDESTSLNLLVCNACGTQHPTADRQSLTTCFICDDPRQYVPPAGQSFSTLLDIRKSHRNVFTRYAADERLTFIQSEPKVGIGQRAILIKTAEGNVLWDCVTLLDDETIARIKNLGGLKAIVISHPHFYSTHVEWGRAFGCPVYLSGKDRMWLARESSHQVFMDEVENAIAIDGKASQMKAIVLGGHFPGSLVLLWDGRLMIADTLFTVPGGTSNWSVDALGNKRERPANVNSYSFLWSIPNAVPLPAETIERMWSILKHYDFRSTHGHFPALDIEAADVKQRVLDSMKIQIRAMGSKDSPFLQETLG